MLLSDFESIYRKIFNAINNPSLTRENIDQIIKSDCSLTYNPTFFCIMNRKNLDFDYISKNMHACLGASVQELKENGIQYIWNRIHPKDLKCLYTSLDELLYYINHQLTNKDDDQFSYSWNYRFRNSNNNYINIIQNTTPFCLNGNSLQKGLTHFTVINDQFKMPIQASVNLLNAQHGFETKYTTNCSRREFLKKISRRERDVIQLLAQKHSSKSIGEKLFISSNTVDTHRRNILKKLKLSSTGELINILKTQQLIG